MPAIVRKEHYGSFGAHDYMHYHTADGQKYMAVFSFVTCGPCGNLFSVGIPNGLFEWERKLPLETGQIDNWNDAEPLIIAAIEADGVTMPDELPFEKWARDIAAKHVAKSREEVRDDAKVNAWGDDAKAAEFAEAELNALLEELKAEKQEDKPNEQA